MPSSIIDLFRSGVVDQLASCYPTDSEARALLLASEVPPEAIAPMNQRPMVWWTIMCQNLLNGAGDMESVLARAALEFPGNPSFPRIAAINPLSSVPPPAPPDQATVRPGSDPLTAGWIHAHVLDRLVQISMLRRVFEAGRSALVLLHGHRDQALFQFIRRLRIENAVGNGQVIEVAFRQHGQDRGPLSASLWMRDIEMHVRRIVGAEDLRSACRQHPLVVAVEAPYPTSRSERSRIRELALRHLPPVLAQPTDYPLLTVLVVERSDGHSDFVAELADVLRPVLQDAGVAFRNIAEVTFPDWHEVESFLDELGCPADLQARIEEQHQFMSRHGGSFIALASLVEHVLDEWKTSGGIS